MKYIAQIQKEFVKIAQLEFSKSVVPKKDRDHLFSYKELEKDYWTDIWQKAKEHFNTRFDWENNNESKDETPKTFIFKRQDPERADLENVFRVRCQMWFAGGDWEYPSIYFRCQLLENSFNGLGSIKTYLGDFGIYGNSHVILIPPKEAGNNHLTKGKKGWVALNNGEVNDDKVEDLEPKKAWQWVEDYFRKMINNHVKGNNIQKDNNK